MMGQPSDDAHVCRGLPSGVEPLTMLGEDGTHLLNQECVNFVVGAEMGGPVAVNDGQQAGHLSKHGLVSHRI